jgi:hypothetical protein
MICDGFLCINRQHLGRFYDPVSDMTLTLCPSCFEHFKQIRQQRGLPVPNVRREQRPWPQPKF